MVQLRSRLWCACGLGLFICGLVGDGDVGVLLLTTGRQQLFFWHFPFALIWAVGVNLLVRQGEIRERSILSRILPHKWGITALLLGAGTFPGLGSCAYSIAFLVTRYFFAKAIVREVAALEPEAVLSPLDLSPPDQRCVQPLVDDLREGDTEVRRAAVAKLCREANPAAACLLRELLLDAKAEIRSDASIALVRLDDDLSRTLNSTFEAWSADQEDIGRILALVDQYYQYATSNVLDRSSQRFYLVLAHDLLLPVLAQRGEQDAQLWLKLARIRQGLGELTEALQAACQSLQIQPADAGASLLAMELAFRTHAWETLALLAGGEADSTSYHPHEDTILKSFQWWRMPFSELCGDTGHD